MTDVNGLSKQFTPVERKYVMKYHVLPPRFKNVHLTLEEMTDLIHLYAPIDKEKIRNMLREVELK